MKIKLSSRFHQICYRIIDLEISFDIKEEREFLVVLTKFIQLLVLKGLCFCHFETSQRP